MRKGHGLLLFCESEGEGECSIQMHFDQTNASNTASRQKFPLINEFRLLFYRKLPLKCPQHATKRLRLLFIGGIIPRKVNIDAPTGQLRIHFSKGTKFVGAHQKMADPSKILKI